MHLIDRPTIVLVEDRAAYEKISRDTNYLDRANSQTIKFATLSPYLAEHLAKIKRQCILIDDGVTQGEADAIGNSALSASRALARYLDTLYSETWGEVKVGWSMRHVMHRSITTIFYKAYLLGRLQQLAKPDHHLVVVGTADASPVRFLNPMYGRFDPLFSVLAARAGIDVFHFKSPWPIAPADSGDFLTPTFWSRFTTVLNAPFAAIFFRLWSRYLANSELSLPFLKKNYTVALFSHNELIEDALPYIFRLGCKVVRAPELQKCPLGKATHQITRIDKSDIAALLDEETKNLDFIDSTMRLCAIQDFSNRLTTSTAFSEGYAEVLDQYVRELLETTSRPPTLLTNSMTSPQELLLRCVLRKHGIPVVVVEHGVAPGLSDLHRAQLMHELAADYDGMAFWTPVQEKEVSRVLGSLSNNTAVTGSPNRLNRIGLENLQRFVVRTSLKIPRDRHLVTWCTGLFPNNMQFLPHYWRDGAYHSIRKEILFGVLADIDYDVLLKLYPTFRFNDPEPFSFKDEMPKNIVVEQFKDFRSLRAAADVILIDGPGSVLGWAWGCQKPIIYIETGMYTLRDEIAESFREAVFFVDVREGNWRAELAELLGMPVKNLRAEYKLKASKRFDVGVECIFGDREHSGIRLARFLEQYSKSFGDSKTHSLL